MRPKLTIATQLRRILDERGNLTVFQNDQYFPFQIKQVSWLWNGQDTQYQLEPEPVNCGRVIIVLAGKLVLWLSNTLEAYEIILTGERNCVYVAPFTVCQVIFCSSGTFAFLAADAVCSTETSLTYFFGKNENSLIHS